MNPGTTQTGVESRGGGGGTRERGGEGGMKGGLSLNEDFPFIRRTR